MFWTNGDSFSSVQVVQRFSGCETSKTKAASCSEIRVSCRQCLNPAVTRAALSHSLGRLRDGSAPLQVNLITMTTGALSSMMLVMATVASSQLTARFDPREPAWGIRSPCLRRTFIGAVNKKFTAQYETHRHTSSRDRFPLQQRAFQGLEVRLSITWTYGLHGDTWEADWLMWTGFLFLTVTFRVRVDSGCCGAVQQRAASSSADVTGLTFATSCLNSASLLTALILQVIGSSSRSGSSWVDSKLNLAVRVGWVLLTSTYVLKKQNDWSGDVWTEKVNLCCIIV